MDHRRGVVRVDAVRSGGRRERHLDRAAFVVGIAGSAGAVLQGAAVSKTVGNELVVGSSLSPIAATVTLLTAAVLARAVARVRIRAQRPQRRFLLSMGLLVAVSAGGGKVGLAAGRDTVSSGKMAYTVLAWLLSLVASLAIGYGAYAALAAVGVT